MSQPHAPALDVREIRKSYGTHEVLRGVDLRVEPGQILGLLGRNGAGKSTLITILCGLRRADSGTASICGHRPASADAARLIGYAPQELGIYPDLSVTQNLAAFGELHGLGRREAASRAGEVVELLGLSEKRGQRASHLSGGQQRRLHAGMAIMHRPRLVFMDEPTVGADVEARSQILRAVRQLADEGAAVVYTSHYLAEFEELGSDIAILNEGRVVARGTLEEIIAGHGRAEVTLEFDRRVPVIDGWSADDRTLRHIGDEADPGSRIGEALASPALQGARLMDVHITQASLHNAYLQIIKESDHVAA
ncbi:ABC transporter ATP-binding protein [uncultured Actinomyces sp.]|uniref:ABC transporter ATP-binding protein n=1 Tax=uncultured Actinomyces sp. TaxID=249061 RepID=UPI00325FD827